jgi:hypothetical protein
MDDGPTSVGDAGAAGFREHAGLDFLLHQGLQCGLHLGGRTVFIDEHEADILDDAVRGHFLHEAAGGAQVFDQEVGQPGHGGHHLRRQHLRGGALGQRGRKEVKQNRT